MTRVIARFLRPLSLFIWCLAFSWNAEAGGLFTDYSTGNFDAVRKHLTAVTYANLDGSGKDSFLNIADDVYAQRPEFPLSELASLYEALSHVGASAYKHKRLNGLMAALGDPELRRDSSNGNALVRLNALGTALGQLRGFVVPHDINGRLAVMGLYAMRRYKESQNEQDLLAAGYAESLRGRSNHFLEAYLTKCEACVYSQQVKRIVRDGQLGGVGIEPYLVNAQPYEFDEELDSEGPEPSPERFPVQFIGLVEPAAGLKRFVASLIAAAEAKDAGAILPDIAADFTYEREFGGMVSADMSAAEKFLQAFTLDNRKLAEEYQDYGWNSLLSILWVSKYQVYGDQVCGPAEPATSSDMPDDYYFYAGYINGTGVRVRAEPTIKSGIIQTLSYEALLSMALVEGENRMLWAKLRLRNGEIGYVAAKYFGGFLMPQLCFSKVGADWKISSYIGGGD